MNTTTRVWTLGCLLVLAPPPCGAADHPVHGWTLSVTNPIPNNPHLRHVAVSGRDGFDPVALPFVGDPIADGVTLTLFTEGASSANQAFVLPPGGFHEPNGPGWRVSRSSRRPRVVYTYVDERGENGSIVSFILYYWQGRRIRIGAVADGRGNNPTIDVVPPNPGTGGGLIVQIPGGDRFCAVFGGAVGGKIGKTNDATTFRIKHARSALCPPSD